VGDSATSRIEVLLMAGPSAAVKFRKAQRELLQVPSRVASEAAPVLERLWRKTWRAGQDPYGVALPALAPATVAKKGHDRIMIETGETLRQTHVRPMAGAGLALSTGVKTGWHLEPSGNRPARPELPLRGLPVTWKAALERIYQKRAREAARG
jgi:hypothetical protein